MDGQLKKVVSEALSGQWLVTGVGHNEQGQALELRSVADPEVKRIEPIPASLALRVSGPRRCIGYRAPGSQTLAPCPDEAELARGSQCSDCVERAKMVACLRCTGLRCNNPDRRDDCVQTDNHAVYLASFGPGSVKVGVARWNRRRARLIEQGAVAALIVARHDGQMVRRLESSIRGLGIADRSVNTERLAAMWAGDDVASLVSELQQLAKVLRRRLPAERWLPEAEVVDLPRVPQLTNPVPWMHPSDGELLEGPVRAGVGQWIVFERSGSLHALELVSLVGYTVMPEAEAITPAADYQLALPLA